MLKIEKELNSLVTLRYEDDSGNVDVTLEVDGKDGHASVHLDVDLKGAILFASKLLRELRSIEAANKAMKEFE